MSFSTWNIARPASTIPWMTFFTNASVSATAASSAPLTMLKIDSPAASSALARFAIWATVKLTAATSASAIDWSAFLIASTTESTACLTASTMSSTSSTIAESFGSSSTGRVLIVAPRSARYRSTSRTAFVSFLPVSVSDEVLHQRPALSGRELADRVDDPAVLLGLPVAVDQGSPLLRGAERDCLEELAMVVDVRQRLGQGGRDPQPLGPRCSVGRLVERADLRRVRLRRPDAELQLLGAELRKRSDLARAFGLLTSAALPSRGFGVEGRRSWPWRDPTKLRPGFR